MGASTLIYGSPILMGDNTIPGLEIPKEIKAAMPHIFKVCRDFGLDFYETVVQFLTYDEISEIAAYSGFPVRYPHWSFGMEYEELSKGYEFGQHRIFEMVINNDPCYLYCLDSNTYTDNVTVIAHALGHNDFFKNNLWFAPTHKNMMNEFGNHRSRIIRYMQRWGKEVVGSFIDQCLSLETLVDPAKAWTTKKYKEPVTQDKRNYQFPRRLKFDQEKDYMDSWINDEEFVEQEKERIRIEEIRDDLNILENKDKDIMGFLRENANLRPWQQDVLDMLYKEAMYFQPQRMTKTINEGWACICSDSLLPTTNGFVKISDVVHNGLSVDVDGGSIVNWFKHEQHDCIQLRTRRGLSINGSVTHRLMLPNGEWKRLDEFKKGEKVKISYGSNVWSEQFIELAWQPHSRMTWNDIAGLANCSMDTVRRAFKGEKTKNSKLPKLIEEYDEQIEKYGYSQVNRRNEVKIPTVVTEEFASFLGYLTGDGQIASQDNAAMGITTADDEQVDDFSKVTHSLFGVDVFSTWDDSSLNGRWRCNFYSVTIKEFLLSLGLPEGFSARIKKIPDCVLRSPKKVIASFIRSYFDCDAGAYENGIILSTSSVEMVEMIQVVLLNFGILSRRYLKEKDNWHVYINGKSAKVYLEEIGFGLSRKQNALISYVNDRKWFVEEELDDEIIEINNIGKHDVYDITVAETHRYSAQGFVNHNSFVDYNVMARIGMPDCGIVEYADHKARVLGGKTSQNPYKLGFELLLYIEDKWNKGRFGKDYEQCEDNKKKEEWDLKLGLGHQKVFEVREKYNDVTLIHEFFDQEFCDKFKFYEWKKFPSHQPGVEWEYKIVSRDAKKIKNLLMQRYLNGGLPDIRLVDYNGRGKGIMVLEHQWDGRMLLPKYTTEVIKNAAKIWGNPVALITKNKNEQEIVYVARPDSDKVEEMKGKDYKEL